MEPLGNYDVSIFDYSAKELENEILNAQSYPISDSYQLIALIAQSSYLYT